MIKIRSEHLVDNSLKFNFYWIVLQLQMSSGPSTSAECSQSSSDAILHDIRADDDHDEYKIRMVKRDLSASDTSDEEITSSDEEDTSSDEWEFFSDEEETSSDEEETTSDEEETSLAESDCSHDDTYTCLFPTCLLVGFRHTVRSHLKECHSSRFLEGAQQYINVEFDNKATLYNWAKYWAVSCMGQIFRIEVFLLTGMVHCISSIYFTDVLNSHLSNTTVIQPISKDRKMLLHVDLQSCFSSSNVSDPPDEEDMAVVN